VIERRRLGVLVTLPEARVGAVKNVQPLGERGHHPVLDAVVHHLHEVAGTRGAAVEIALLLGCRLAFAAGRPLCSAGTGRERREDRLERGKRVVGGADHEAEPPLQAEDAAARAAVDVTDPPLGQLGCPADVVR
jgi:hypothetical protein